MTRINTNVSSLVAQNTLVRSHAALDQSLTRLSTGLRINTGKDDPAGLIASENLRSDITSIQRAIGNTDRANQVISTADSALGQVSSLLNDIRGLVTESANTGALSKDQIAADQLQIDSSLKALNRIAQTTTFQGRRLLDGSLDFITSAGTGFNTVSDLKIDQANLGSTGQVGVAVNVTAAATQANVNNTGITSAVAGAKASTTLSFADGAANSAGTINVDLAAKQATGTLAIAHAQSTSSGTVNINLAAKQSTGTYTGGSATLTVTAVSTGAAGGAVGGASSGIDVNFVDDNTVGNGVNTVAYNAGSNTITVNADFTGGVASSAVAAAIQAFGGASVNFTASGGGTNLVAGDIGNHANVATGGRNASTEAIALTGVAGAAGNATFTFTENNLAGAGTNVVNNGGGSYTIQIDNSIASVNISAIAAAIQSTGEIATATYGGSGAYFAASDTAPVGSQSATGGSDAFTDNLVVTAKAGGNAEGATGSLAGGIDVIFIQDSTIAGGVNGAASSYNAASNEITLAGDFNSGSLNTTEIKNGIAAIGSGNDFTVTGGTVSNVSSADIATHVNVATGGRDASTEAITIAGKAGAISNFTLNFAEANLAGAGTNVISNGGGSYTLQIDNSVASVTLASIATAIQGIGGGNVVNTATYSGSASYFAATDAPAAGAQAITGGRDAGNDVITVQSDTDSSTPNTHTVTIVEAASHGLPTAAVSSGNIIVTVDSTAPTTINQIATAIDNLAGFSATKTTSAGDGSYTNGVDNAVNGSLAGGVTPSGGLDSAVVLEISGATGANVLSFGQQTGIQTIVDAINSGSDSTGVTATNNGGLLKLQSTAYGSDAFVNVNILSGDTNGTFAAGFGGVTRANGTDIDASVNGIKANGRGNTLSINTASLDLSLTVDPGSTQSVNFTITGGGAQFQLGPEVVSSQQVRVGITSVNTAKLGGVSGKLFQLGSGGTADLATDPTTAANIVDEAINQITSLRGRLGAFQRTSLETNKNALNDTLVNLTDAQSQIRDADFASETANLTRAQILVQSGTTVLGIANQNPQNVLSLLRNA
jgi:flagellin